MSEAFSRLVPSKKFSMASVQVYLMQHKCDPAAALARGYTITMDENGQILRSAKDAMKSQELTTRFHDGEVKSEVLNQ